MCSFQMSGCIFNLSYRCWMLKFSLLHLPYLMDYCICFTYLSVAVMRNLSSYFNPINLQSCFLRHWSCSECSRMHFECSPAKNDIPVFLCVPFKGRDSVHYHCTMALRAFHVILTKISLSFVLWNIMSLITSGRIIVPSFQQAACYYTVGHWFLL